MTDLRKLIFLDLSTLTKRNNFFLVLKLLKKKLMISICANKIKVEYNFVSTALNDFFFLL